MYRFTTISFPELGLEMDPVRQLSIGPLSIHLYGLIIGIGMILAVTYGMRRAREFGLTEDHILDGFLWVMPFAVLCARLYYCLFSWEMYRDNPISIFYIWEGGLAIYGGVLGAALGVILLCKIRKIDVRAFLDLVTIGFLIGQSLGRWGNFFNREAFGAETESFLRMGLYNAYTGETTYHHPTFLYESLWNAVGFVLLHFLSKRRKYDGQVALGYVAWYGLGRALIEGLRTDSLYIPGTGIRVSQLLAAASCGIAVLLLVYNAMKNRNPENLFVNRVNRSTEENNHKPEGDTENG